MSGHADGLCAIYLDKTADRETVKRITVTVEAKVCIGSVKIIECDGIQK
jgi:gamma-glutamyl phosphate reductase